MLHRDVKPNNILVSRYGEPALADFGVSCLLDASASGSVLDVFSPQHAAPELMTRGVPSVASDVYALASSLFELLMGHPPFGGKGQDVRATMFRTVSEPAPRADCPGLPGLADAIERAMAKDPLDRFPDAATFARALRALIPREIRIEPGHPAVTAPTAPIASTAPTAPPPSTSPMRCTCIRPLMIMRRGPTTRWCVRIGWNRQGQAAASSPAGAAGTVKTPGTTTPGPGSRWLSQREWPWSREGSG
ncbi:protein kinase [Catenulispora yoronensis]